MLSSRRRKELYATGRERPGESRRGRPRARQGRCLRAGRRLRAEAGPRGRGGENHRVDVLLLQQHALSGRAVLCVLDGLDQFPRELVRKSSWSQSSWYQRSAGSGALSAGGETRKGGGGARGRPAPPGAQGPRPPGLQPPPCGPD